MAEFHLACYGLVSQATGASRTVWRWEGSPCSVPISPWISEKCERESVRSIPDHRGTETTMAGPRMTTARKRLTLGVRVAALTLITSSACVTPGERARLVKDREALQRKSEQLEWTIAQRDGTIATLSKQVRDLQGFGPDRPADLFAPVRIDIVSRSGGSDYDGKPGDDGVTVYLRPIDSTGDGVKAPGQITIQLLDNTNLDSPRLLGVYRFDDSQRLRMTWYGKFGTQHYTLKCPFAHGVLPPRHVNVSVEFIDYLTGRTLRASKEVTVSLVGAG